MGRGADIRNDGTDWGTQGGLLSEAECDLLWKVADDTKGALRVLEVGHYRGLSTVVLADGVSRLGALLVTVDWHEGGGLVEAAPFDVFWGNVLARPALERTAADILPMACDSRGIEAPLHFDFVFYDGDHGLEQMRFTQVVHESPLVKTFVFDDRDFLVPSRCCEFLRDNGWIDDSPGLIRGQGDKTDPETMTLGVFRRAM